MDFSVFRSWFDEHFFLFLGKKIKEFSSHSSSGAVRESALYIETLAKDGKRFRPYLSFVASGCSAEDASQHVHLWIALELLHLFALIHDDIMDQAETRHGVACAQVYFKETYGVHTAQGVAILLGDIVFAWAYDALVRYTTAFPEKAQKVHEIFASLVSEVTHGQLLDIISPVQPPLSEALIIQKMTLKTARYSFVQPLRLGFVVKEIDAQSDAFAEAFGTSLGNAFQVQDDIIDTLPTQITGKSRFTDIQTKQQTLLSWYMKEKAPVSYREKFDALYGRTLSLEEEEVLSVLLRESGAFEYLEGVVAQYMAHAAEAIALYQEKNQAQWEHVVALIAQRKK